MDNPTPEIQAEQLIRKINQFDDHEVADALFELLSLALRANNDSDRPEERQHADSVLYYAHLYSFAYTEQARKVVYESIYGEGTFLSDSKVSDGKNGRDEPIN
ncbi:MAG: hypothetical protein M3362_24265 [Acidobacteriota bacterium]|nr:hypothetical protein [Acidobacteriota bacterium]